MADSADSDELSDEFLAEMEAAKGRKVPEFPINGRSRRLSVNDAQTVENLKVQVATTEELATNALQEVLNRICHVLNVEDANRPNVYDETIASFSEEAEEAFTEVDEDSDGMINLNEFKEAYEWMGLMGTVDDVEKCFKRLDKNSNGLISMDAFREAIMQERQFEILVQESILKVEKVCEAQTKKLAKEQKKIRKLQEKKELLIAEMNKNRDLERSIQKMSNRVAEMEKELEELRSEIKKKSEEADEFEAEVNEKKERENQLMEELNKEKAKNEKLSEEKAQLNGDIDALEQQVKAVKSNIGEKMEDVEKAHAQEVKDLKILNEDRLQALAGQIQEAMIDIIHAMQNSMNMKPETFEQLKEKVSKENLEELKEAFNETDENGNGYLDFEEANNAMEYIGMEITPDEMRLILSLESNTDQQITESWFVDQVSKHRGSEMRLTKFLEIATELCSEVEKDLKRKDRSLTKVQAKLKRSQTLSDKLKNSHLTMEEALSKKSNEFDVLAVKLKESEKEQNNLKQKLQEMTQRSKDIAAENDQLRIGDKKQAAVLQLQGKVNKLEKELKEKDGKLGSIMELQSELFQSQKSKRDMERKLGEMGEKVDALNKSLEVKEVAVRSKENAVRELQVRLGECKKESGLKEEEVQSMKEECVLLKKEVERVNEENKALREGDDKHRGELIQSQGKVREQMSELSELRAKVAGYRKEMGDVSGRDKEVEALKVQIKEYKREMESKEQLEREFLKMQQELQLLEADIQKWKTTAEQATTREAKKRRDSNFELDRLRAEMAQYEGEFDSLKAKLEETKSVAATKEAALKLKLKAAQSEIQQLKAKDSAMSNEIEELEAELKSRAAAKAAADGSGAEVARLKEQLEDRTRSLSLAQEEIKQTEDELHHIEADNDNLKEQMKGMQSSIEEANKLKQDQAQKDEQIEFLNQQVQMLKDACESLRLQGSDVDDSILKQELKKLSFELEEAKSELTVTHAQQAKLEQDWINGKNEISRLKNEIQRYQSELSELELMQTRLDQMQEEKTSQRMDNVTLKHDVESLQDSLTKVKRDLEKTQEELKERQEMIESLETQLTKMDELKRGDTDRIINLEAMLNEERSERSRQEEIGGADLTNTESMQQLLAELNEMRKTVDDMDRVRDMNEHLKELLSEKTEELSQLREQDIHEFLPSGEAMLLLEGANLMASTAARALIDILDPIRKLQSRPKDSYEEEEEAQIESELRHVFQQFAKTNPNHLTSSEYRYAVDELGLVTPETNQEPDWLDPLKDGIDEDDFIEKVYTDKIPQHLLRHRLFLLEQGISQLITISARSSTSPRAAATANNMNLNLETGLTPEEAHDIENLKHEIEKMRIPKNRSLESENQFQLESHIEHLEGELSAAVRELDSAKQDLQDQILSAQNRENKLKMEYSAEVKQLRLENEVLKRKMGGSSLDIKAEISNLKREAATREQDLSNRIELLEKRKEEMTKTHESEMRQLTERIDELKLEKNGAAEVKTLENRRKNRIEEFNTDIQSINDKIAKLSDSLISNDFVHVSNTESSKDKDEMIKQLRRDVDHYRELLKKMRGETSGLRDLKSKDELSVRRSLAAKEQELEDQRIQNEELQGQILDLQDELDHFMDISRPPRAAEDDANKRTPQEPRRHYTISERVLHYRQKHLTPHSYRHHTTSMSPAIKRKRPRDRGNSESFHYRRQHNTHARRRYHAHRLQHVDEPELDSLFGIRSSKTGRRSKKDPRNDVGYRNGLASTIGRNKYGSLQDRTKLNRMRWRFMSE